MRRSFEARSSIPPGVIFQPRIALAYRPFNAFNHAQFQFGGGSLATSIASPAAGSTLPVVQYVDASQFGRVIARDPRIVQFAVKLIW